MTAACSRRLAALSRFRQSRRELGRENGTSPGETTNPAISKPTWSERFASEQADLDSALDSRFCAKSPNAGDPVARGDPPFAGRDAAHAARTDRARGWSGALARS